MLELAQLVLELAQRNFSVETMAWTRKPIDARTAGVLGILIFLVAWTIFERVTDTASKSAPPGTTIRAADRAGATVTPSEDPSSLGNL